MPSLIDKLNVLVRSSINNVLGVDSRQRDRHSPLPRLGKNVDREIAALRQQIDQALDHEERLIGDINALKHQIADGDRQADAALSKGDEATARHTITQVQIQQRRMTMLEADLAQHRLSTSELISRVNTLEALVAEARQQQKAVAANADDQEPRGDTLSDRLRKARQQFEAQIAKTARRDEPDDIDEQAVEDDLARRRARLMGQD
ncbi:MAG: PspA/IM30 family protein [Anaerolineae bacterium]|nr:PspA/IM30 family protein [Anaerolineae bacterium]